MKVGVIGAANMDITAKSFNPIIDADSNIGKVSKAPGGVARNIASALKAMGFDVSFLTALANDQYGIQIAKDIEEEGITLTQGLLDNGNYSTGIYCCIMDGDGSLVCAVNDMEINETLSPALIEQHKAFLESCDYVVFDANLPLETIKALSCLDVKLVADCVSVSKASKLSEVLENLYLIKANFAEACVLAEEDGLSYDSDALDNVMQALVAKGLRRAIISLGKNGAFCYEVSGLGTKGFDARVLPDLNVVSANGCGDVLLAGFLRALSEGAPFMDALYFGMAASGINAESVRAVSPELNIDYIKKRAEKYYE